MVLNRPATTAFALLLTAAMLLAGAPAPHPDAPDGTAAASTVAPDDDAWVSVPYVARPVPGLAEDLWAADPDRERVTVPGPFGDPVRVRVEDRRDGVAQGGYTHRKSDGTSDRHTKQFRSFGGEVLEPTSADYRTRCERYEICVSFYVSPEGDGRYWMTGSVETPGHWHGTIRPRHPWDIRKGAPPTPHVVWKHAALPLP